ncbi:hypothetical protein IWW48_005145 [Coemansia sp. RSA 1200]|nr:hypothetical protein IWW48_005145 [Coemansia sp. RSA 1200]
MDPKTRLPRPRAKLLIPEGGVLATRVHYETLNDAMFLLRVTLLSSVLCVASAVLLSLATANVNIRLGIGAIAAYPKLLFASSVWSSTSVFSAILVAWFMVYCVFSHIVRLHFNSADPPRDWDDRNGEWSVVELDVRPRPKLHPLSPPLALAPSVSSPAASAAASHTSDAAEQWRLGVLPAAPSGPAAGIVLLTPDTDYALWLSKRRFHVPA